MASAPASEWIAEWKWDGIRSQLIRRSGRTFLWSRGDELLNGRFPEVEEPAALLPEGTVIDGELLPWAGDRPLPFAQLQRRIGRKTLTRKVLDEVPVALVAYDLLEQNGEDLRPLPLERAPAPTGRAARRDGHGWTAGALTRRAGRRLGRARCGAGTRPGAGRRGPDAQAAEQRLRRWAAQGRLVEMEDRALRRGCGADVRAGGEWAPGRALHRLHLRRVGRRPAGAVRQGILGTDGRGDPEGGQLRAAEHGREASARCAWSDPSWCSSWRSRASSRRHGTSRGSRCASPGSRGGGRTSGRRRRIRWSGCGHCCHPDARTQ